MRTPRNRARVATVALFTLLTFEAPPGASLAAAAGETSHPLLDAPLDPFHAVALFDFPEHPWSPGHRGIDISATVGDAVVAPADGTVTFAGAVVDRGVVTIATSDGLLSSVEPVKASVSAGDVVHRGDVVGVVTAEHGHCAPVACLHWGVRRAGMYLNPLDVLAGYGPVRLLPLG